MKSALSFGADDASVRLRVESVSAGASLATSTGGDGDDDDNGDRDDAASAIGSKTGDGLLICHHSTPAPTVPSKKQTPMTANATTMGHFGVGGGEPCDNRVFDPIRLFSVADVLDNGILVHAFDSNSGGQ